MVMTSENQSLKLYTKPFELGSKIVAHTISGLGNDIITWEVRIPKWMVAEFNTHKVEIERNSASSRAVPISVVIDMVMEFPCMPHEWRYNAKGMEAPERLNEEDELYANMVWLEARDSAIESVRKLQKLPSGRSADKQRANRILEFCLGTVIVVTMTGGGRIGINNFFGLRDNKAAVPEFEYVARMMHDQYHTSAPHSSQWHLPYIDTSDVIILEDGSYQIEDKVVYTKEQIFTVLAMRSSARCGRVTHYRQGQEYTIDEDLKRAGDFATNGHYSPLRHAARAGLNNWYGNMFGWEPIGKIIKDKDYVEECCRFSGQFGLDPELYNEARYSTRDVLHT